MMKKLIKIPPLILLIIVLLTGCTNAFNHYEDKLYSEKALFNDKELSTKTTNVLTRENAIKKALSVFEKGLNIKIDRTNISENIKLVKNIHDGRLQWEINWNKIYDKNFYRCVLDSSTGKILEVQLFSTLDTKEEKVKALKDVEVKNLIEPFFKQLDINVNDYEIVRKSDNNIYGYKDFLLHNKDNTRVYNITIDLTNKAVIDFKTLEDKF